MASGDYLDLAQEACRRARRNPADLTGDLPAAQRAVNQAYLSTLDTAERFGFLEDEGQFTISSAADTYSWSSIATAMTIPDATIAEVRALTNDTIDADLLNVSWEEMEELSFSTQDDDGTGLPVYWCRFGEDTIRFYPKPDQSYTIGALVILAPTAMVNDSDVPLIPYPWRHRLIVPYAAAMLLRQEGGIEARQEAQDEERLYRQEYQAFVIAHASARAPQGRLLSRGFARDLPGSAW